MATTIYSGSNDGYCLKSGTNWVTVRDADTGSSVNSSLGSYNYAIRASVAAGRGGTNYAIARTFLEFDVSGITHVPQRGQLRVYGNVYSYADVVAVKSNQSASLATSDFDAIEGWDGSSADGSGAGSNSGNVTIYGSVISSWSTTGYNDFTLSQQALVDIAGLSTFKVCLIEEDADLRDITPVSPWGPLNYAGVRFSEYSGTSSDPALRLTEQDNSVFVGCNF